MIELNEQQVANLTAYAEAWTLKEHNELFGEKEEGEYE